MNTQHHELSPSAFPAWKECPCFNSDHAERADASAGTAQHLVLAALLRGDGGLSAALPPDAREAVEWAARFIRDNAGSDGIETEVRLRHVGEDGAELYFGTADVVSGSTLYDFKSGDDSRDYTPQLAAYALARFDTLFDADVIRCFVLHGRIRKAKEFSFTREQAASIVEPIIAARRDPNRTPKPCDWCAFCADRITCPALIQRAVVIATRREDFTGELPAEWHASSITCPRQMAKALNLARFVGDWADSVRHHATELAKSGVVIPGYRLQERRGPREVTDLAEAFNRTGLEPAVFVAACKLSLPKLADIYAGANGLKKAPAARELEAKLGDLIVEGKPTVSLVRERGGEGKGMLHD